MDLVERTAPASRLERSGHSAFIDNNTLFVFGGYQVSDSPAQVCAANAAAPPPCLSSAFVTPAAEGPQRPRLFPALF